MIPSQLSSSPLHFSVGTAQPQGPPQAFGGETFVDLPVAVVVDAVAGLDGAVPRRLTGPGRDVVGIVRVVRLDAEVMPQGVEAGAVGVSGDAGGTAVVGRPFIDLVVTVVVLAVAELGWRNVLRDDADQRRLDGRRVGQGDEDGLVRAAGGGDPVGGGLLGVGETAVRENVGLDALGDDRRMVERAGGHLRVRTSRSVAGLGAGVDVQLGAGGRVAGLRAVGGDDDDVLAAGLPRIERIDVVLEVHARVEQRAAERRVVVGGDAQLGVGLVGGRGRARALGLIDPAVDAGDVGAQRIVVVRRPAGARLEGPASGVTADARVTGISSDWAMPLSNQVP